MMPSFIIIRWQRKSINYSPLLQSNVDPDDCADIIPYPVLTLLRCKFNHHKLKRSEVTKGEAVRFISIRPDLLGSSAVNDT
jgi:hypothetical protein